MRCDQIIRRNASPLFLSEFQNARQVLRRNAPRLPPPIDRNRLNTTLGGNLVAGADSGQCIFDCCVHVPNNDYFSHSVKRLKQ